VKLTVTEPQPVPLVKALVSAASMEPNSAAPRSILSIFGEQLASWTDQAAALPLPTRLGNAQVLIDGQPSALLYASPNQINFVMPDSLASGPSALLVRRGDVAGRPTALDRPSTAPAFFSLTVNGELRAAITNAEGNIVYSNNPASRREVLVGYLTGMGAAVVGSSGLRLLAIPPRIYVDSIEAELQFAGPVPGMVGLDQINFVVPDGARPAEVDVWVEQQGRRTKVFPLPIRKDE